MQLVERFRPEQLCDPVLRFLSTTKVWRRWKFVQIKIIDCESVLREYDSIQIYSNQRLQVMTTTSNQLAYISWSALHEKKSSARPGEIQFREAHT